MASFRERRSPACIVSDIGAEFHIRATRGTVRQRPDGVGPCSCGKIPAEGFIKILQESLRDGVLNEEVFDGLADARRELAVGRYDDHNVRQHSWLGNRTPAQARRA